jgi:hypothetical protein
MTKTDIEALTENDVYKDDVFLKISMLNDGEEKTALIKKVKELCKTYEVSYSKKLKSVERMKIKQDNACNFIEVDGFEEECFFTEEYTVNNDGVWVDGRQIMKHPVFPVAKMVNKETGARKIELFWRRKGEKDKTMVFDNKIIASREIAMRLYTEGIGVNAKNSSDVSKYLQDMEIMNSALLPEKPSISRLGWVDGQFSPYLKGIYFDGDPTLSTMYSAIKQKGDFNKWKNAIIEKCDIDVFRFLFIASLSAPLLEKLSAQAFLVHIEGLTGGGKTLTMQACLSAWGDPLKLILSHKSTKTAIEISAHFLQSIPICLDETQEADKKRLNEDIYMLSNGQGGGRGKADMTLREPLKWRTITISTGEISITDQNNQAGAINRVLALKSDIEIYPDESGSAYAEIIHNNFGFLGEKWINYIILHELEIQQYYQQAIKMFKDVDSTGKQVLAMSVIATGLEFFNRCFGWGLKEFGRKFYVSVLKTTDEVNPYIRAFDHLNSVIVINQTKFKNDSPGEKWGCYVDSNPNLVWIVTSKLIDILDQGGFSFKAVRSQWKDMGYIEKDKGNYPHSIFGAQKVKCYCLRVDGSSNDNELPLNDEVTDRF